MPCPLSSTLIRKKAPSPESIFRSGLDRAENTLSRAVPLGVIVLPSVRALAKAVDLDECVCMLSCEEEETDAAAENKAASPVELCDERSKLRELPMNEAREVTFKGSDAPTYTADMRTEPFGGVNCGDSNSDKG